MLTRKAIVLAKTEVSYGVDAAPTGALNSILISNLDIRPIAAEFVNRDNYYPYLGNSDSVLAAQSVQMSFEVELAGSGAAGTAPKWAPLLLACGFAETVNAGVDVVYAPISAAFPSLTMYCNRDGVLHKLLGARGTVQIRLQTRQIPKMAYTFTGLFAPVADAAAPVPVFTGFQKPLAVNKTNTPTFTLHGVTSPAESIEIDLANQVVHRSLIGAELVQLTDRRPVGSISMEATSVATKDWWDTISDGTLGAMNLVHGLTAGNIVEFDAPSVQILDPTYTDSEGNLMLGGALSFIPGASGNDEITITVR